MSVPIIGIVFFAVLAIVASSFGGPEGAAYATAIVIIGVVVLLVLLSRMTCAIQLYEIGLVSVFGSYRGILRPGFNLVSPVAFVKRVNLRTIPQEFSVDGAKTKDRAPIQVKGLYYYRIVDAVAATFKVQDPRLATLAFTQSELRRIVHEMNLADILSDEAEALAKRLEQAVNDGASKWGVKAAAFEIKDVVQLQGSKFGSVQPAPESVGSLLPSRETSNPQECPYCHAQMEKGTVGAESLTGGAKWHKSRSTLALGGEPVGDYSAGGMVWLDGYRCKRCDKLILHS